jgi:hypothetical protein
VLGTSGGPSTVELSAAATGITADDIRALFDQ